MTPEPQRRRMPFVIAAIGATIVALLCGGTVSVIGGIVVGLVASADPSMSKAEMTEAALRLAGPETPLGLVLGLIPSAMSFALFAVLFTQASTPREERNLQERIAWRKTRLSDVVLATVGMLALSGALGSILSLLGWNESGTLKLFRDTLMSLSIAERTLMLPAIALLPGIGEELFFRGFLFNRGSEISSVPVAAITSALLFGAVHFDPAQGGVAIAMGLFLAFVVLRTGSVIPAIVAHIANNSLATMAPDFGEETSTAYLLIAGGTIVFTLSAVALFRRR